MTEERWLPVPGWDGYEVSNFGRVRSTIYVNQHGRFQREPRVLEQQRFTHDGYRVVCLTGNGFKAKPVRVHRLVLLAFVGAAPAGHVAGHTNGQRDDNRLSNLRWITFQENSDHMVAHGTRQRGERHPRAKISDDDAQQIRDRARSGERQRSLAAEFGVTQGCISHIVTGRNRSHT